MADVLFVVKTFLATFILVVLMQVQVKERTLENHLQTWIRGSAVASSLRSVAHGGVKMLNNGYQATREFLAAHILPDVQQEQIAGSGGFRFSWDKKERIQSEQEQNRERIRQLEEEAALDAYGAQESSDYEDSTL